MKVALLTKDAKINGGNRVVANLAEKLNFKGYHAVIYTSTIDSVFDWCGYSGEAKQFNCSVGQIFDVAISFYFSEHRNLRNINAIKKIKYVQANYDKDGEENARRIKLSWKYLVDNIAENVVVSKYLQDLLLKKGIFARTVRPAIDKELFFYDDELWDGTFRILIEGGLSKWKRVKESYKCIPEDYEVWGLGPEDHKCNAAKMWVNPEQNKLRKIYSACGVLVKLAVKEGHPLSILESMSCGLIPVVSNDGGHLEYCRDRVNSFITSDSDQVKRILYQIRNMENANLNALRMNAISTAYERNWDDVVKELFP